MPDPTGGFDARSNGDRTAGFAFPVPDRGLCPVLGRSVAGLGTEQLQELYTRTFDLNPVCTLEIGWQLYGEDYHRGEFLVKMRQQLREHGLPESSELPDHMTHALALLARLESEEAAEFGSRYLLPAIDKMLSGWRDNRNAYAALLESLFAYLKSRYPYVPVRAAARSPELPVLQ